MSALPIGVLAVAYLGYLGTDLYTFTRSESSPLAHKRKEMDSMRANNGKLNGKVLEVQSFSKKIEGQKQSVQQLTRDLEDVKKQLTEHTDVPSFMKMAVTEAKKVGLKVLSLNPDGGLDKQEFFMLQKYVLRFRGAYVQLLAFVDRISNVTEVVGVDNFSMKPVGSVHANYVEMEGMIQIKTYNYLVTQADIPVDVAPAAPLSAPPAPAEANAKPAGKSPAEAKP
jgi:Tfp pilus assembly protein PilO